MRTAKLGLILAAGLSLSLAAVDPGSPQFATFAADLGDLVPENQRATLAEATDADGAGDHYHPSGEAPGITPPEADIALGASFEVELGPGLSAAGGVLDCETGGTLCSAQRAGLPAGTRFHAYAGSMQSSPSPGAGKRLEFGVAALDETPRDERPAAAWEAIPEFRGDNLHGSNVVWTLLSENGAPFTLFRLEYGPGDAGFLAAPTDAIAIVRGSAWAIVVPIAEWEGTVNGRLFVFRADGDFAAQTSVVDTYPDIFQPAVSTAGRPTIVLASIPSRGLPTWALVALGLAALLALTFAAWPVTRRRRVRSG